MNESLGEGRSRYTIRVKLQIIIYFLPASSIGGASKFICAISPFSICDIYPTIYSKYNRRGSGFAREIAVTVSPNRDFEADFENTVDPCLARKKTDR